MTDVIVVSESFDEGSAYGTVLKSDNYKDVGYASGPWKPQHALLRGINKGLSEVKSHVRVYLEKPQIPNYLGAGVIDKWKSNDWTKLSGVNVEVKTEWQQLLDHRDSLEIEWTPNSDHDLLPWARRCALCAIAEIPITSIKDTSDMKTLTDNEAGMFWQSAKESGFSDRAARRLLADYDVISAKDAPKRDKDSLIERASSEAIAKKYIE